VSEAWKAWSAYNTGTWAGSATAYDSSGLRLKKPTSYTVGYSVLRWDEKSFTTKVRTPAWEVNPHRNLHLHLPRNLHLTETTLPR
jgi:hypothetical protein